MVLAKRNTKLFTISYIVNLSKCRRTACAPRLSGRLGRRASYVGVSKGTMVLMRCSTDDAAAPLLQTEMAALLVRCGRP
jgi:hypothetical protein